MGLINESFESEHHLSNLLKSRLNQIFRSDYIKWIKKKIKTEFSLID